MQMEEDVNEARSLLERILENRRSTPVDLERVQARNQYGTCTYYVSFPGFQVLLLLVALATIVE